SFALQVAREQFDYYVLELSSFMLDDMFHFRADVAVLLNITPDHLDRYEHKLENYVESKFRIIRNQQPSDIFIYCADDPVTMAALAKYPTAAQALPFSLNQQVALGAYLNNNNELVINVPHQDRFTM